MCMNSKVEAPPPQNYGQQTRDTLQAQIDLAPALLKAEQTTRPGYTELDLQQLNHTLFGSGGGNGLAEMYSRLTGEMSKASAASASGQREADIGDVSRLGPMAIEALRRANPAQFALLDELNSQAKGDLEAGSTLTPDMAREIEQYVRKGQSARGMVSGPSALYQEAMTLGSAGQALKDSRRRFAAGMIPINQSVLGDQFMQILGRPSTTMSATGGVLGQGSAMASGIGPQVFQPESQLAADIANNNYQGTLAARTATASNRGSIFGGALGAFGALGGGALQGWTSRG